MHSFFEERLPEIGSLPRVLPQRHVVWPTWLTGALVCQNCTHPSQTHVRLPNGARDINTCFPTSAFLPCRHRKSRY